jgi:hypothetical protein
MEGNDELIFSGAYKDFSMGVRFDLSGKSPEDVAHALAYISSEIEPHAFRFSGIDMEMVEDFAKLDGKGLPAVCDFLENRSSEWNKLVKEKLGNPLLKSAATSYLLNRLLVKADVAFKVLHEPHIEPEKEEISDVVAFIGKYKSWIAIKKLGLEKVKDYEVSGILSGINFSVVNKAFDFSGIEKDDAAVKSAARGKRKSLGNVVQVLKAVEDKADNPYVVCKALEELGMRPYASPHMLTDAYPDIKPPKVRGRKPKG